ncbi:MAG: Protein SphX [Phycisphaerae bacterium]|nr:Protein SphX [Phycisphaerae bacterium]
MNGLRRIAISLIVVMGSSLAAAQQPARLTGKVSIDGSSTVAPIMKATAELFRAEQPQVKVSVGISGTTGGFKKFLEADAALRTDISAASRPITAEETRMASERGIRFVELPVAYDGLAVVVNKKNDFCKSLTLAELKRIWEPESKIRNWKDVRPGFPDMPLRLYGPGTASGTFDYFTEVVVGKARASRSDYTGSEDDNVIATGVEGDIGAMGYLGYSYFALGAAKLNAVAIDPGDGKPVAPDRTTISDRTYRPLARPLFVYVNVESLKRAEVEALVTFFYRNAKKIVEHPKVNYVVLEEDVYAAATRRLADRTLGSLFADHAALQAPLRQTYVKREND